MGTINQVKQRPEADTPILFFECTLPSGDVERWSSHSISLNGQAFAAKVVKHNLFELQLAADDAMDGISQLSVTLANADSELSELNAAIGFKGSQLTVYFAFVDLPSGAVTTESTVLFKGIAGDPDEITENTLTLSFANKLSLQRIPLPEVRVQRSCPWNFPATPEQRLEATDGGDKGRYSRYYRCGYSADIPGGSGNLNGTQAFTTCDKSRGQCTQRGMFDIDSIGNTTRRFGGFEFVPTAYLVRTAGDKTSHLSPLVDNTAKYNDAVPLLYGTGWLKSPVIFARNDGNLTHVEALIGLGQIQGVLKVVVNDVEIPQAAPGVDMSATGWYGLVSDGGRQGVFNADFEDSAGNPMGDPHGSLAVMSVVVPNRISTGSSVPTVQVLLNGLEIDSYNPDGTYQTTAQTPNPAWIILDILKRSGWSNADLNLSSFASAAEFCQEVINTEDLNGNPLTVARYACNLILVKRQSAATLVRGIRVNSSLMLRYGLTGLLELLPETTLAAQQATLPDGSNSAETLNGGWPAYEFSDASGAFSGIARNADGSSSVRITSRTVSETSNRLSVEFQDESNEYQQDSLSLVDTDDTDLMGFEVSSASTALGIPNFSQATRVLLRQLDKSTKGNQFVQFSTSFRALKLRPGDVFALTYLKEGLLRAPFRVMKLSPSMNYEMVTIYGQTHDDEWYSDDPSVLGGAGRQPGSPLGVPRPLLGLLRHDDAQNKLEYFDFQIEEYIRAEKDGSTLDTVTVGFVVPNKPTPTSPNLPLLSLAPDYDSTGGTFAGGSYLYYAMTAVDDANQEGSLSFTVPAVVPTGTNTNAVTINRLSFPSSAVSFHVYRGPSPQVLYRIASNQAIAGSFTDPGLIEQPMGPPDASFDHANIYYRYEFAGPFVVDIFSSNSVGWTDMGANNLAYSGMIARIIEGTGRGQERSILTNDRTTLTVTPDWSVVPDVTSLFVVAEASWKLAAISANSPAQFDIPYQSGTVIQISGRAANVNNQESNPDLGALTILALGGGNPDVGLAAMPSCSLGVPGAGDIAVFGVGFADASNTESVTSGTLQLFYWNEVGPPTPYFLAAPLTTTAGTIYLTALLNFYVGQVIQVGQELMTVVTSDPQANSYQVFRGALGSVPTVHFAGDPMLLLDTAIIVMPFANGFFQNRAESNYIHTVNIADIRISGSEFYVTNSFGDSQANAIAYTSLGEGGLRTLSGGQFSLQVNGVLATQQNAAPPLIVEAAHAVRDVRATLGQAASGYTISVDVLQNAVLYASLNVATGTTNSNVVDGVGLPPLAEASLITINVILSVISGYAGSVNPGRDLTVTIRL